jgi:hypothetical protein
MIMATKAKSPLLGRWRITWMDQWDQDFVDEETEGYFEMDAVQGRGWATLDGNEITGMIFIHQGDESEFKAAKRAKRK